MVSQRWEYMHSLARTNRLCTFSFSRHWPRLNILWLSVCDRLQHSSLFNSSILSGWLQSGPRTIDERGCKRWWNVTRQCWAVTFWSRGCHRGCRQFDSAGEATRWRHQVGRHRWCARRWRQREGSAETRGERQTCRLRSKLSAVEGTARCRCRTRCRYRTRCRCRTACRCGTRRRYRTRCRCRTACRCGTRRRYRTGCRCRTGRRCRTGCRCRTGQRFNH